MIPQPHTLTRNGAYGVLLHDSKILLTLKKSGPFQGLWDLPGGGIEFGETPEETLKREMIEETALAVNDLTLLRVVSTTGEHVRNGQPYRFHHIGIIYQAATFTLVPKVTPEEEGRWVALDKIQLNELTPFAKQYLEWHFAIIKS